MTVVLDAGAFLSIESGRPDVIELLAAEREHGRRPRTHAGVVAQVWRGGHGSQARLAAAIKGCDVIPFDLDLAKRAGVLLAETGMSDVVDAGVAAICGLFDTLYTSDPDDLGVLLNTINRRIEIVTV